MAERMNQDIKWPFKRISLERKNKIPNKKKRGGEEEVKATPNKIIIGFRNKDRSKVENIPAQQPQSVVGISNQILYRWNVENFIKVIK